MAHYNPQPIAIHDAIRLLREDSEEMEVVADDLAVTINNVTEPFSFWAKEHFGFSPEEWTANIIRSILSQASLIVYMAEEEY